MCGIVGYIGKKNCVPLLIEGLKMLEYRGYDSSGIALLADKKLSIFKKAGKISSMESTIPDGMKASVGIGHTRWATHGAVSDENAHPHQSANNKFSIVHNGIIENYKVLREKLIDNGFEFRSNTDSEVIAHLLELNFKGNFETAFHKTISLLQGAFGVVAISVNDPSYIMVARKGSPLALGIGNDEMFVASDVSAFLGYTKQVVYLEDNEISKISMDGFVTKDFMLAEIEKEVATINWNLCSDETQKFPHYMLKEIFEQPESISRAFAGRILENIGTAKLAGLNMTARELHDIERVGIIGCGTSYHAGLVGAFVLEELARIPATVHIASEVRTRNPIVEKSSIYFAISQSGETLDTLEAMRELQRKGAKVLGICNAVGGTIPGESDGGVYVHSGPEIAVASTKAFTSQLTVFYLYAILMGRIKDLGLERGREILLELRNIPNKMQIILNNAERVKALAEKYAAFDNFVFLGRGVSYPVALEAALKLKEVTYKHAEAYPSGEFKHGPIALVDEAKPVVFIVPRDQARERIIVNIEEIITRGGRVIAICNEGDEKVKSLVEDYIEVPETDVFLSPLLTILPLQLFAYYIGLTLGRDIDNPRNLTKAVTED